MNAFPQATPQASTPAQVLSIQPEISQDRIRVIVGLDSKVQFTEGTALDPYRIFFDLQGAQPAAALPSRLQVGDALLPRIRVGLNQAQTTRIVLELTRQAHYTVSFEPNPPRLVIDVAKGASAAGRELPALTPAPKRTVPAANNPPAPQPAAEVQPAPTTKAAPTPPRENPGSPKVTSKPPAPKLSPAPDPQLTSPSASRAPVPATSASALMRAAQQGSADAQFQLGDLYLKGEGVARDPAQAAKWYMLAAQQGHALAASNLGVLSANGQGVPQSDQDAVRWFRAAAEKGEAAGQANLGAMYLAGRGIAQNDQEAAKWLAAAAQRGVPEAQYSLGTLYANGRGVSKDEAQAVKWLQSAADRNYPPAQLAMGRLYVAGTGVLRDYAQAFRMFLNADVPEAWYQLGLLHQQGWGTPPSDSEALKWFTKAANRGLPEAQYAIGCLYMDQDPVEAYSWFSAAAAGGDKEGIAGMNSLASQMTPEDMAEARHRALARAGRAAN